MARKRNSRKSRTNGLARLGKPNGIIQPRVQAVGPQRFGVVAIDCAKARSKWMLCDFYGKVLVPPTEVEHARTQMQLATLQFREACQQHNIRDAIVAVEMTGTYHRPIQRAFRKAGVETRLVHPFASKHYRHPSRLDRGYVMDKLLTFHRAHETPPAQIVRDLQQAARQIPRRNRLAHVQCRLR